MAPTLLETLRKATAWLEKHGIDTPRLDAEVLFAHGLGLRRIDLYLQHDRPLTDAERDRLRALVTERGRGVPSAYLTGVREFHALPFEVTPAVLVPRPETEGLVDVAVEALAPMAAPTFADVGTGSGCVAIATLVAVPAASAHATDVSEAALEVARRNAARHGVATRLAFHRGRTLEPLRGTDAWGRLDAVVSNPPYVVRGDPTLAKDVAEFEPAEALYVEGGDALSAASEVATSAREALRPGGLLALEVGATSGEAALSMLAGLGYLGAAGRTDGAGILRIVSARTPTAGS